MKKIFKLSNKVLLTALLTGLVSSLGSAALESRTFFSADKSKSFKGTLTGYHEENEKVRVRTSRGKDLTFKLNVLSKECQDYISKNASKVAVASALNISFDKVKVKKLKGSDSTDYMFDVTFSNRSETILKNLTIDYTVHYKKDTIEKGQRAADMVSNGTFGIYELDPSYDKTETTSAISITRKTIKGKGGGWCGGPVIPGGRLTDQIVGIVVDVKVDGEIVLSDSNNRTLLSKVLKQRGR